MKRECRHIYVSFHVYQSFYRSLSRIFYEHTGDGCSINAISALSFHVFYSLLYVSFHVFQSFYRSLSMCCSPFPRMVYEYIMHINNIHVYLFTCILSKYTQVRDVLYTEYLRLWTQVNPDLAVLYIHRALLRIYRALLRINRERISAVVDPSESRFGGVVYV